MRRVIAVAAALAVATALAGCSSDEGDDREVSEPVESDVVEIIDQPGSVDGYVGALDDSELTVCEQQGDALHVEGTVTNPESDAQDYRIYVSAMDGNETRGLVQVDVPDVASGGTANWSTDFDLSDSELTCVLRVERFATS